MVGSEFRFPTLGPLPHRDPLAGVAFGKGGARGVFQAGVAHAFILSGYFPRGLAGTSVGALAATTLAVAANRAHQRDRLALVDALARDWIANPGRTAIQRTFDEAHPLRTALRELGDIDLTLGDALRIAKALNKTDGGGKLAARAKLALALPYRHRRLRAALWEAASAALRGGANTERFTAALPQALLTAYGMEHSLLGRSAVDAHFGHFLSALAPNERTFGDLGASDLIVQVANVSRPDAASGDSRIETLDGPTPLLVPALRAAMAVAPLFPAVRAGEVFGAPPAGTDARDLLLDAAPIEKAPLTPLMRHWKEEHAREGTPPQPRRLFVVYQNPINGVAQESPAGFFGPALRSLHLLEQRDMVFNQRVVSLMTRLVEALEGTPDGAPRDTKGRRYLAVYPSPIAPDGLLGFSAVSGPDDDLVKKALASGCRSALEVLHAETIRSVAAGVTAKVSCSTVLARAREQQTDAVDRDEYFVPVARVCEGCTKELAATLAPGNEPAPALERFAPLERARRPHVGGLPKPLTVVVPSGGVFLGVFQVGALAALRAYGVRPDLYAGASVGTLFSFLLQSAIGSEGTLREVVKLMTSLPEWVDGRNQSPVNVGRVDRLIAGLKSRWAAGGGPLRALRLRELFDLFDDLPNTGNTARIGRWYEVRAALDAVLFEPRTADGALRPLPDDNRLTSWSWSDMSKALEAASRGELDDVLGLADALAASVGVYEPSAVEAGEVVGFQDVDAELRRIVFGGEKPPTLAKHAESVEARFLFTATNHTRGVLEYFGGIPSAAGSPLANEASLAASSFPVAFRRRRADEVFGATGLTELYADGGILNNFPSDAAFEYLRYLSGYADYAWLGQQTHRVLLLTLTAPSRTQGGDPYDARTVTLAQRAQALGQDEKVAKTLGTQEQINQLARAANPLLRAAGEPQAVPVEFDLVAPAYDVYPHAFAFKRELGYDVGKQREMLAAGCRRTRVALEWRRHRERNPSSTLSQRDFEARVNREIRAVARERESERRCVLGQFSPEFDASKPCPTCSFASASDPIDFDVFRACRDTAWRDEG